MITYKIIIFTQTIAMRKFSTKATENPAADVPGFDPITEIVRLGAQKILEQALRQEIDEYLKRFEHLRDDHGHQSRRDRSRRRGRCERG